MSSSSLSVKKSHSRSVDKNRISSVRKHRIAAKSNQERKSHSVDRLSSSSSESLRESLSESSTSSSPARQRISKSVLCNLDFPVGRVKTMMKVRNHGLCIGEETAVFTTAVLNYLTREILEMATIVARNEDLSRIQPRHVNRAVKMDPEIYKNFMNASIPSSPFIPLEEIVNDRSIARQQAQGMSETLPGSSNALTASVPPRSCKSEERALNRRRG